MILRALSSILSILVAGLALTRGADAQVAGAHSTADTRRDDSQRSNWSIDDLLLQETAGQFQISPDGRYVVWIRSQMDVEKGEVAANLWITRSRDGEAWPLTRGLEQVSLPRWSPDGRTVAFLWDRPLPEGAVEDEASDVEDDSRATQLWALRLEGGEPWPLTTRARGLSSFAWKGWSGDTLVFLAQEAESRLALRRKTEKDAAIAVEDTLDAPPTRLWSLSIEDGEVRRLTSNRDWIQAFALSPDGRSAATVTNISLRYVFDEQIPPLTHIVDMATGLTRRASIPERTVPLVLEWTADGRGFLFSYLHSNHPVYRAASVQRMGFYDAVADAFQPVDLDWERGLGLGFEVVPDGFLALLADGLVDRPARYARHGDGWRRELLRGPHVPHLWGWSASDDGRWVAFNHSTASTPPRPYLSSLRDSRIDDPVLIADLNPGFAVKPTPRVEQRRWTGALNEEVEGLLTYPVHWEPGRSYPLIVSTHGGPAWRDADDWFQNWAYPTVLHSQQGAFVLQVNYHGSAFYGLDFVESIADGRYYELPLEDIEAGVDLLISEGLVHPDSIAAAGWSNGSILSIGLVVENPDRYRVLVAGAGDVEWLSDWANVDFGAAFDNYYFGGSPLDDPQRYIDLSPFFRLDRVQAPTLIFFGTEDRNVPTSQGWSHFRALQQLGKEVRFVLFPGEAHGLESLASQRRKVQEELIWLRRHLYGDESHALLALAGGSPLEAALGREAAARTSDGLYGVPMDGVLVPELVSMTILGKSGSGAEGSEAIPRLHRIEVGRFEVTRAQWHAFDPSLPLAAGEQNLPVTGVTYDQALSYVSWLSTRSGEPHSLPTATEFDAMAAEIEGGVTLDWWAGYAPNPEDRERLGQLSGALPSRSPLLLIVGSLATDVVGTIPSREIDEGAAGSAAMPLVFDLGGNAAEWAIEADGTGIVKGGSADRSREETAHGVVAAPEYRGLRVVRRGEQP
ncbi:MAG TPA: prolyl oligopeptidase family serine peptidase [Gemmatimonadota bacterium]|nr:prolyl oligopeptidase family serine peptidase [Gemmatimonadota bacterium]